MADDTAQTATATATTATAAGDPAAATAPAPEPVAAAAAPAPENAAKPAAPATWQDAVATLGDEHLRTLAGRYTSLEEAVKAHAEARKLATARDGWVKVPGKTASEDEIKAWRKALGVPDAPEAYGVALPEAVLKADPQAADRLGMFLKLAHERGVSREAVGEILAWHSAQTKAEEDRILAADQEQRAAAARELVDAWGDAHQLNGELGARAALWAGGEELTSAHQRRAEIRGDVDNSVVSVMETIQSASPALLARMFHKIGRLMAPEVPQIAQPLASVESEYEALNKEYQERASKGTVNDTDFQRRWAEVHRKRAA